MNQPEIIQIIPAAGWEAKFRDAKGEEYQEPLMCLALVRDENGVSYVDGILPDNSFAMLEHDFAGFGPRDSKPFNLVQPVDGEQ